jgi:hypothetical protein
VSIDVPHRHVDPVLREVPVDAGPPASGNGAAAANWQPVIGELVALARSWQRDRVEAQRWGSLGAVLLVAVVLMGAAVLGAQGVLGGEAIAVLFGGAAGFLLARLPAGARA